MHAALYLVLFPALCGAQARLPLECDDARDWHAQPGWVPNPALHATVESTDGALAFAVNEPRRGMKWSLETAPVSADLPGYLVVRCRSEDLIAPGPYVLWAFDSGAGGAVISAGDVPVDGEWHEVAVNLLESGRQGFIRRLAVEVQAGERVPARLSFDYLRFAAEPPPGAIVLPRQTEDPREWRYEFNGDLAFEPQVDWLGNPAPDNRYSLDQADGTLVMRVDEPGKGMKWSAQFDEPVDLSGMRFFTVRYRAAGATKWGDYFVWVGSETGGMPRQNAKLASGTDVTADGRWHTQTAPVEALFPVKELAVQLQAAEAGAMAEIDYIAFSDRRPLLPLDEVTDFSPGWQDLRLSEGRFSCISLPPVANAAGAELARWLGVEGWFTESRVTLDGIPFQLSRASQDMAAIPLGSTEPFTVPIGQKGTELFLLVALRPPSEDLSGMLGPRPLPSFRDPERFRVAVDYADGLTDWHFPARAADGIHEMTAGVGAYVVGPLRPEVVTQIRLRSAMRNALVALAAVTANHGDPVTRPEAISTLPPPAPPREVRESAPRLQVGENTIALSNAYLRAEFSTQNGIALAALDSRCLREGHLQVEPGPLFTLAVGEARADSTQVTVGAASQHRAGDSVRVELPVDATAAGIPLKGRLRLQLGRSPGLEMALELTHVGDSAIRPEITFPLLKSVVIGSVEDTWYLDGRQGGVINRVPMTVRVPYSGRHPMQITDLFNPDAGGGMYVMTHDLADIYRYYSVAKDADGIDFAVDYFPRDYQPGEAIEIAPTVIAAHTGDWRVALDAYKQWVGTWYRPAAPRKQWFQECFNYRQHLVRGGLYSFEDKQYRMNEVLEKDIDFFGRVDYFHIFDFGQSDTYGRVGDYSHYGEIGGVDALAGAIRGVQGAGVRVGLYIEGYLVDERGVFGRDHVGQWHIIKANGEPLLWADTSAEHMMCPAAVGWQDYLAATYKRVASELHPDGMYIDQHGFGNEWKICYSPDHGHFVPMPPIRGERDMGRKIRAAVPPAVATLTEEVPTDVNSQYQDGALGYSVAHTDLQLAPHRIHLFRFCFPDFKVFQLVSYNNFVEGGWARLKFPFLNGEGTWLGNRIPGGFDADAQAFLRRSFRLLHDHRAAFISKDVEPLVPTESPLICANRFSGDRETVWTLLNIGYATYRGPVLRVPARKGAKYLDLWNDRPLEPEIKAGNALLAVEIGPQEVGCLAQAY